MTSNNEEQRIAICGGGLVGCLAACYFAKRNFKVDLYEYRDDIRKMEVVVGRSINMAMSTRGRAALRRVGCEEYITSKGIEMHSRMLHDTKGNMSAVRYGRDDESILSIDRRFINELLLSEAEKYENVKIHFNHKLIKCNTNTGELLFENTRTKQELNATSDLIVGCDGSYSVVRQSLLKEKPIDYSQTYISSYYLELRIPPTEDNQFAMPTNYLHIWPRGEFMMIALPNQDKSFTGTIFMPLSLFESIKTDEDLMKFFEKYFPNAIPLIGKQDLIRQFFLRKPLPLISIKCNPHHGEKCVLLGDASHSMVPFYGQGMNCALEDCIVFFEILDTFGFDELEQVLTNYSKQRVPDAQAMCDLAMYNYIEMRHLVATMGYKLRKKLDNFLFAIFPNYWIPLYTMVTFSRIRYSQVVEKRKQQDSIIQFCLYSFVLVLILSILMKVFF